MLIFLALAFSGLVSPGPGGFNVSSFNPGNIPNFHGIYLGVVFTILALSGFESVAPLSEETENPRRNLPIAIIGTVLIIAIFYTLVNWGVLVGHGTTGVQKGDFTASDQIFDLARRLWGGAWLLVLFATVSSSLAVSIAIQNASTRVFFSMGRAGALPSVLGKVHPRWRTPWNAIWLITAITLIIGLGLGSWFGPANQFGFVGIFQVLGLVVVYSMGNLGAFRYFWGERRSEFNWFLHFVIPLASSLALIWVAYKTIEGQHLLHPKSYADYPFWVALVWIVLGVIILFIASRTGKEAWLMKAGQSAHLRPETAEELAHEPTHLTSSLAAAGACDAPAAARPYLLPHDSLLAHRPGRARHRRHRRCGRHRLGDRVRARRARCERHADRPGLGERRRRAASSVRARREPRPTGRQT